MCVSFDKFIENWEETNQYNQELRQENEELKKKLFSPDQVETTCPKCGERYSINYCKEVYKLEEENKKLKEQLKGTTHCYDEEEHQRLIKENKELNKYCCKRNDCGGRLKENNKPTDSEVLTEFEKWLEEEIDKRKGANVLDPIQVGDYYIKIALKASLNKLQELKEGKK